MNVISSTTLEFGRGGGGEEIFFSGAPLQLMGSVAVGKEARV